MKRHERSDDLAEFERDLLAQIRKALNLPLSPRTKWFIEMGKKAEALNRAIEEETR